MEEEKNDAINDPRNINTVIFLLTKSIIFIRSLPRITLEQKRAVAFQIL